MEVVFNYDIPDENEYYLHRIGRTGRAKRRGIAVTFMTQDDRFRMRDICKYTHSQTRMLHYNDAGILVLEDGTPLEKAAESAGNSPQNE